MGYLSTDVDECVRGLHSCRRDSEACFNVEGSYRCGCQWGYLFDNETQQCVLNDDLMAVETRLYRPDTARDTGEPEKPGEPPSADSQHWHSTVKIQGDSKRWTNFVRIYFLNYTWYVNDLHNI